jgi:tetratricopeptide (TPR) repeat protein
MGTVFAKKNMPEEAENAFKTALSYDENHFLTNKNLGTFYLIHKRKVDEAIPMLDTALKVFPHDPEVVRRLAYAYRVTGQHEQALPLFERALGFKSFDPKALLYLSEIYLMKGIDNRAEELINRFSVTGSMSDIGLYMDGVPERDLELDFLWPYKKKVLERLSETYSRISSNYDERKRYVKDLLMESQ